MRPMMRVRGWILQEAIWVVVILVMASGTSAWAQIARQDADQRQVYLLRKDAADCSGSDVPNVAHYPIEPYGEIKRWYGTLSALPAWQKTLAQTAMPAASAA